MIIKKEDFDVALIEGARIELSDVYQNLRHSEEHAFDELLNDKGEFYQDLMHSRNCPLCNSSSIEADILYNIYGIDIVRCLKCSFVYSNIIIKTSVDKNRYQQSEIMDSLTLLRSNSTYSKLESNKAQYIYQQIKKYTARNQLKFLDIGSSTGALLDVIKKNGDIPLGIEPNINALSVSRKSGHSVVHGYFPDDLPKVFSCFDVISILDVLEHIEDPINFLTKISAFLSSNGLVCIQVPNFNSLLIRIEGSDNNNICPGHWSYFTPNSLSDVIQKAGLRLLSIETIISEYDRILTHPRNNVLSAASELIAKKVSFDDISPNWIQEYLLGYKILAVCRKA